MEGPIVNLWIQDTVVILLEWDHDSNPIRAAIAFNRLSALRIYEEWLAGRDPEGLQVVQEAFLEESAVPWTSPLSPDFSIPRECLEDFTRLLMVGSETCTDHNERSPEDLLEKMLGDDLPLYCYASAEEEPPLFLLLYLDEEGVPNAVLLRDRIASEATLLRMTRYSNTEKEALQKAFERLPKETSESPFYFHQVTTAVLLIGAIIIREATEELTSSPHQLD